MCTKRVLTAVFTAVALLLPAGATAQAEQAEDNLLISDSLEVKTVIPGPAAIGARFRGNHMYVTTSAGLFVYDISNPTSPVQVGSLPLPHFENEDVDLGGNILLISNDAAESYGLLHVIDITDPTMPEPLAQHDMGGNPAGPVVDAVDFLDMAPDQMNPGHTASCILECKFAWVTDAGGMRLIDLRDPRNPVRLGNFGSPAAGDLGITHDVQTDENGIAWISGYGGVAGYSIPSDYADAVSAASAAGGAAIDDYHKTLLVAATDPNGHSRYGSTFGVDDGSTYNDFILHNSMRLKDSDVVYVTEEDYSRPGCNGAGSFETWRLPMKEEEDAEGHVTKVITGEPMTPLDKWETEMLAEDQSASALHPTALCSAHYFDVEQNVVAQGWYEQGLRLLDVSDPTGIRQIAYFIPPNGASWASYFAPTDPLGRVLYLLDASLGIVVLEYDRPVEGPLAMPANEPEPEPEPEPDPDGEKAADQGEAGSATGDQATGQGSQSSVSSGGSSSQGGGQAAVSEKKKRSCKDKKTKKARRACRQKRKRGGSEKYAPTVVAPVREEWKRDAPQGTPSRQFGYACRIPL